MKIEQLYPLAIVFERTPTDIIEALALEQIDALMQACADADVLYEANAGTQDLAADREYLSATIVRYGHAAVVSALIDLLGYVPRAEERSSH
jgi:hypothetical protein